MTTTSTSPTGLPARRCPRAPTSRPPRPIWRETYRSRSTSRPGLGGETGFELSPALGRLFLTVLRRSVGNQRVEQLPRGGGRLGDGQVEGLGVRLRRLRRSAHLADELKRGVVDLLLRCCGLEVMELSDVSAHGPRVPMTLPAPQDRLEAPLPLQGRYSGAPPEVHQA